MHHTQPNINKWLLIDNKLESLSKKRSEILKKDSILKWKSILLQIQLEMDETLVTILDMNAIKLKSSFKKFCKTISKKLRLYCSNNAVRTYSLHTSLLKPFSNLKNK